MDSLQYMDRHRPGNLPGLWHPSQPAEAAGTAQQFHCHDAGLQQFGVVGRPGELKVQQRGAPDIDAQYILNIY